MDPRDCETFPLRTDFHYAQVPFTIGFPVENVTLCFMIIMKCV